MNVLDHPDATLDQWMDDPGPLEDGDGGAVPTVVRRARARTALTPSGLEGYDYALNPYHGCAHGCAYCYAPSVISADRETFCHRVAARQNLPAILSRELRRKERGVVGISTVTDPYQPAERRCQVTRFCLERLLHHDWPVSVLTKSDLVVRDADLLEAFSDCEVGLTVTTMDEHQRRLMEPGAPPVPRRLAAMRLLSGSGIRTYAFIGPVYPTATASELRGLVREVHDAGASYVLVDRLNLRRGVWMSVSRALAPDQALIARAREVLLSVSSAEAFYARAFAIVEEEAEALGLSLSRA